MRLIDADALLKEDFRECFVDEYDNTVFETIIENAPTVDIKTKVAKEIFAEIERFLYIQIEYCKSEINFYGDSTMCYENMFKSKRRAYEYTQKTIAELKNKYTKEGVGE